MKKLILILALFVLSNTHGQFLKDKSKYSTKDYATIKGWGYKEMPPSQVTTYTIKLSDKSYSVGGYIDDPDATFYYNALWQDLGWIREGDEFTANAGSHRPKRGYLYFHLKREVAIYFYPKGTFNAFKVTLNTSKEED